MADLISRVPVQSVVVVRNGSFVTPALDKPFGFTEQEIADIEASNPAAIREPVVEKAAEPVKPAAKTTGKAKADEGL